MEYNIMKKNIETRKHIKVRMPSKTKQKEIEQIIFIEFINMISNIRRPTRAPLKVRLSK